MPPITNSHSTPYFEQQFEKLSEDIQRNATKKIFTFESNPFHPGLDTHKLKGKLVGFWSFSITKKVRVLFRFLPNSEVIYYDIGDHDIYR